MLMSHPLVLGTRPPLIVVFVAVVIITLGVTAGAVMSQLRPQTERYAQARIRANAATHGLAGSPEYDDEVVARTVFTAEAGLSFLHTHAMGLGPVVLLAATVTASVVPRRWLRGLLYALLGAGGLFPCGYLVYALAVLEAGRDAGVELAEWWVLTPLGSAMILGLIALAVSLASARAAR
jgi:hypothetical protein